MGNPFLFPSFQVDSQPSSVTPWVRLCPPRPRDVDTKKVAKALIDILDDFPSYELQSEAGSDMAIRNMESRLSAVASFEPVALTADGQLAD